MRKISIKIGQLHRRLAEIQRGVPKGYKVALFVIHPAEPTAHVFLGDATDEQIAQAIEDLKRPDTVETPARECCS